MEWKSYIWGIISGVVVIVVGQIINFFIIKVLSKNPPSKTQLRVLFEVKSKFSGFNNEHINRNESIPPSGKYDIEKALKQQKESAKKLIQQRLFIHKAKRIISMVERKRTKQLTKYLERITPKLDKYYVENWTD